MEIQSFFALVVPFMILFYLAVLLFIRAPRNVVFASLLGGVIMGLLNLLVDLAAYYAHWWHYNLSGLILHLPLPFYATPVLIYGSLAYLLIWRFWHGRAHWFSRLLLIGIPIFGVIRDIGGAITGSSYVVFDNIVPAVLMTLVMWVLMFYAGYVVFKRLSPPREEVEEREAEQRQNDAVAR
ncbi:MAG TPA: hypothetical protein VKY19_15060 [Ktedonosporobacter sp.]|jgi:hypothetical protein|nr:hypothetical protein [Ktedonosporobacter sp.]